MSSEFGKALKVSIFGESHGEAVGAVVSGLPAGFEIDFEQVQAFLARRSPAAPLASGRQETDTVEYLSGITNGKTNGAPLCAVIRNVDAKREHETALDIPRPSHGDYTAFLRYNGYADLSGAGHGSGRLTAPLCVAGAICSQILASKGVSVFSHIASVGRIYDSDIAGMDLSELQMKLEGEAFPVIDSNKRREMLDLIEAARDRGDSVGAVIECITMGYPAGVGTPMFDTVESRLSYAVFGIPGVKGVEFGNGFESAELYGSKNNDSFTVKNGEIVTETNNHGGVLGGITSGMPIVFRAAMKPTPSIAIPQASVSLKEMKNVTLTCNGRNDACIGVRAAVCVEAAAAVVLLDMLMSER